ncbi:hypothetical protein LR004_03280 [Candidatus Gracilibacteria bacterium]|nr:hypothetical protein [Candidatus Gracilibacteria bacterium]
MQTIFNRDQSLHLLSTDVTDKVKGLFHIIPFKLLRHTDSVDFHSIPYLDHVNAMERVIHEDGAKSPGKVGEVEEGWYMHAHQEDNLRTVSGVRHVELFHPFFSKGNIEKFEISKDYIKHNGKIVCDGPGILGWPTGVYHRNSSTRTSSSLNLGIRFDGFDVDTEFNIYDVDVEKGEVHMIREGSLDQPAAL